jgi:predicted site-specific integrase-resolvase
MKLSQWAKKRGISYKTAWRWFKGGTLPPGVIMEQMPSGTVIVTETIEPANLKVALYACVSSADQKDKLDAQLGRLATYVTKQGWTVAKVVMETGGQDDCSQKLMELLADPAVPVIVVENCDRLARAGTKYVKSALAAQGRQLLVVDQTNTLKTR